MKTTLQLEELVMFAAGTYLFYTQDIAFWWYFVLILTPDVGMLGYLAGDKAGAFCYNLFHHKGLAIALYAAGLYMNITALQLMGIILFTHTSLDRMMGYGLKYTTGFKDTHLGNIGKP